MTSSTSPDSPGGGRQPLPPIGEGERVSVATVMAWVRSADQWRKDRGELTDDEIETLALARSRQFGALAHIDPRLLDRLLDSGVAHDWNIATDYVIRSHRRGLAASLSVMAKKVAAPFVRLYTDHVLDRQTQINQYLFRVLQQSVRDVVRLEARLAALERRERAREHEWTREPEPLRDPDRNPDREGRS